LKSKGGKVEKLSPKGDQKLSIFPCQLAELLEIAHNGGGPQEILAREYPED
jgi:hypothetical protein